MLYAKLTPRQLEKLRNLEKELGAVVVAYNKERGYVLSAEKYIGDSH